MTLYETTQARIAENQATFRTANERIEASAEAMKLIVYPVPFICECSDPSCTEIVRLTLAQYEEIRSVPTRFFNVPGHQEQAVAAGAAVVRAEEEGHVIVDKIGVAGEIAAARYGEDAAV
jgi:hypothetical protein